jgi:ACS family sodium-dependent inorganic phosphate cotransporter
MLFGGLIAAYWSWEWIFYLSGISGLIWSLCWFYLIAESPATHSTISNEELTYIQANLSRLISPVKEFF